MKLAPRLLAAAIVAALASSAHAEIAIDVIGSTEVSLEGLMQADYNDYDNDRLDLNAPSTNNDGDDTEFEQRRAEVILKGKGVKFDWTVGYDGKANKWLDSYLRWKLGTNYLQGGQFKQPNSLEELASTRHNDFVSKAMVTNLFGVARRVGVAYGDDRPNWGFMLSAFDRELTRNLAEGSGFGGRAYWLPFHDDRSFVHLGVSAVYQEPEDVNHGRNFRYRVRPDADLATGRLVDTGTFTDIDDQLTMGFEGMWVHGPFKLAGEYMQNDVSRKSHDDWTGDSWYLSGVWNITGETWGYKAGVHTTPYPNEPNLGMWQVGVRYDQTDLDDGNVKGGEEGNWTVGLNWYWRSNFKFMVNYVMVDSEKFAASAGGNVDDNPNILELRAQFYW
jgi:phosphate-selective porin OprO/OprP